MSYTTDWKVWTNGKAGYIVAKLANDADELSRETWGDEAGAATWSSIGPGEIIKVFRNPYSLESIESFEYYVRGWSHSPPKCSWKMKDDPWYIRDDSLSLDDYFGREVNTIQIGVKRDCPCEKEFDCVLCLGEGQIVRWIDAEQDDSGLSLSTESLDAEFGILEAYSVLIEAGYRIVRSE